MLVGNQVERGSSMCEDIMEELVTGAFLVSPRASTLG
jgi:hypothetical protein